MGRKHYPKEYRERLVELARSGRSVASLAEEFEPTGQTIRNWLDRANGRPEHQDDAKEVRRLRRELSRVQDEHSIVAVSLVIGGVRSDVLLESSNLILLQKRFFSVF